MVSVSRLVGSGLLISSQQIFENLASPQQAAVDQYNIVRYLGGAAPYVQRQGNGIDTAIPDQCSIEQVHLLSRHGERYPSKNSGKKYAQVVKDVQEYSGTFKGDLAFLNDYEYFVTDTARYEKETTPGFGNKLYSGTTDALKHGASFREKYNSLYNPKDVLPVFSSTSRRVYQTSEYFVRGFLGDAYGTNNTKWSIISEDPDMGANSLTPSSGCKNFSAATNKTTIDSYSEDYLKVPLERFQKSNPGLNLTTSQIHSFFGICAFELNVNGYSPFCGVFTNEELIRYSYGEDVSYYYSYGPGNKLSSTVSSQLLNASFNLLQNDSSTNKIWLSFTHDTNIESFLASLGITNPLVDLPTDEIPFPYPYMHSSIVPQGARLYTEKLKCGDSTYVRYILNDAVVPIPGCGSGPGFSCPWDEYSEYIKERLDGKHYVEDCGSDDVPGEVKFYWDYDSTSYDSALIDA